MNQLRKNIMDLKDGATEAYDGDCLVGREKEDKAESWIIRAFKALVILGSISTVLAIIFAILYFSK